MWNEVKNNMVGVVIAVILGGAIVYSAKTVNKIEIDTSYIKNEVTSLQSKQKILSQEIAGLKLSNGSLSDEDLKRLLSNTNDNTTPKEFNSQATLRKASNIDRESIPAEYKVIDKGEWNILNEGIPLRKSNPNSLLMELPQTWLPKNNKVYFCKDDNKDNDEWSCLSTIINK